MYIPKYNPLNFLKPPPKFRIPKMSIICTNKKIVDFYSENPHLDFDTVNLTFISLIEQLNNDLFKTAEASLSLEYLKDIFSKVDKIDNKQDTLNQHLVSILGIVQSVQSFLNTQKELYVNELKSIFELNTTITNAKITETLDKYINTISNQIKIILIENIPKSSNELYEKLMLNTTSQFKELHQTLSKISETNSLSDKLIYELQTTIDTAYTKVVNEIDLNINKYITTSHTSIISEFVKQKEVYENMSDFLKKQKYNISLNIGKQGEDKLETILNEMFPSSKIENSSRQEKSADFLLKRTDKDYVILFETKEYAKNVDTAEIEKFIRDIDATKGHGIFLSQTSGICGKQAFEINIHNRSIVVYIHNVNYDKRIIMSAVNAIDILVDYIKPDTDDNSTVSLDALEAINNEYTNFIKKRNMLLETLKRNHKDVISKLEDFDMKELQLILKNKFSTTEKIGFVCERCNSVFVNRRALGSHYKGCKSNSTTTSNVKKSSDKELTENTIVSIDMSYESK